MIAAEEECQKVKNQIQKVEFILSENKKLYSNTDQHLEHEENVHLSPKQDVKEVVKETNKHSEKETRRIISSSLPRFMTSTVASRERQSAAEREIIGRAKILRSGTRSSIHFTASQSISYSDRRFKATLQNSNRKEQHVETDNVNIESPKCNGSDNKSTSLPKSRMVTSSDPSLKATLGRHRRRMSSLI